LNDIAGDNLKREKDTALKAQYASAGAYKSNKSVKSQKSGISSEKKSYFEKHTAGQEIHKSMVARKQTHKWEQGQGKKGNLSFLKMKANTNMKHPRIIENGEPIEIPLCV